MTDKEKPNDEPQGDVPKYVAPRDESGADDTAVAGDTASDGVLGDEMPKYVAPEDEDVRTAATESPTEAPTGNSDAETDLLIAGGVISADTAKPARKRGSVRTQDESTEAREPTLAERRARQVAQRREHEAELAAEEEAERKRVKRKRILIGTGVTVGVVAVVAVIYSAVSASDEVNATCTDSNGVVVDENNCDPDYASSNGGYSSGGFIFIGGSSYRYNYGGTGARGQQVTGGSYVAPSGNTTVKTGSGKTVQRGGLGVSGGGKSGGS